MYRFILAFLLIIIMSVCMTNMSIEKFSITDDIKIINAIKKNNETQRTSRLETAKITNNLKTYNNITQMEEVVRNLRDKIISVKELIKNSPRCRKIDLNPNINFSLQEAVRDDRFLDAHEAKYTKYPDKVISTIWNGNNYGNCKEYNSEQETSEQKIKDLNLKCRMDPYCKLDETDPTKNKCDYKQLNHSCYTVDGNYNTTEVASYLIPGTFDNI